MKQTKRPTRKKKQAALATLHKMFEQSSSRKPLQVPLSDDDLQMIRASREALRILTLTLHGEPQSRQYAFLCGKCFLHYTEHFVREKGATLSTWLCGVCVNQLQAQHQIEKIDGKDVRS